MTVKLLAKTIPISSEYGKSVSEFVAYCARVSNPSNQHNHETADKLISYLIRNRHWSPLEIAHLVFEIKCTRDISRQIIRHRSLSVQEYSQRYSEIQETELREPRLQDAANRQSSLECEDEKLRNWWMNVQGQVLADAQNQYERALEKGIAKEVARAVLPEGMTRTTIIVTGSVRSWIHYCDVRCHESTQKEHREIADQIRTYLTDFIGDQS